VNREIRIAGVSGLVALDLAPAVTLGTGPCRMDEAIALFERRQWGLASPALSDCAAADPKNARAAEYFGRTLLAQGQENEPLSWAHFRLAAIYEKTGRKDLARQEYQNALRLDPAMKEARQALAKLS
jgi:tetratricopeptide (TPR) repeat protein